MRKNLTSKEKVKKEFIFKISLLDGPFRRRIDDPVPEVIRRIAIREEQSLYVFARAITKAFDFYFDHCFGFYSNFNSYHDSFDSYELFVDIGEERTNSKTRGVKKTRIKDVFYEYKKMLFLFDYGDGWKFIVEREGIKEAVNNQKYPYILEKIGKPLPQYPPLEEDLNFE